MVEKITKLFLFITLAIPPLMVVNSLVFPFISGKAYLFRFLVEISFLFWIALILKKPEYRPNFKNPLVITTFLFLAGLIITAFLGVDVIHSLFSDFERGDGVIQFGHWVLYFLMLISVLRSKKDWQTFLGVFIAVALLISLYAWFNYRKQPSLFGTFGNPAYFGGFLIFAIGFATVMFQNKFSFGKKWFPHLNFLFLPLIFFFILSLIFTQIRGAYAGLAGGFGLLALLSILFLRKEKKKLIICLIFILMIGLISVGLILANRESQFVKNRRMLRRIIEVSQPWESATVKERVLTWQIAIKGFQDKPIFGWGPENFGAVFNKHYDYRIGLGEPWFDRTHNQSLQNLAEGGAFLFSLYLLWIFSVFYLISKIFRKKKLLAIILASTYLGYLVQSLFLFDIFPTFLGLFSLLGFVYFSYQSIYNPNASPVLDEENNKEKPRNRNNNLANYILIAIICLVSISIYLNVWLPYKANSLTLKYYAYIRSQRYREAQFFLEQACKFNSPWAYFSIRKRGGWEFLTALSRLSEKTGKKDIESIINLYKFITPELEKAANYRPFDQQIYYVLGRMYRLGSEKFAQNDLDKAENILKKSLNYSQYRIEYFNELTRVLVLQGKFEEAEDLIRDYTKRIGSDYPFSYVTLGHLYFVEEKYDLAMPEYQKAKEKGYEFWRNLEEYNRYLSTAEKLGDYQKVVEMCQEYLENKEPNADTFFNLAVGYKELDEPQKAKEYFYKAVEMNSDFEEHRPFFENP